MSVSQALPDDIHGKLLPQRNRAAPDRLLNAYRQHKPLAVVIGEGRIGPGLVIDAFIQRIEEDVDVIRLSAPVTNPVGCTKSIVRALEFETKDLEPADLEQIVTMFLAYQRTHRRRTILCLEDAQDANGWVLDELGRLVSQEARKQYGLLVVLAGRQSLCDHLRRSDFESLAQNADTRISLSPYDLAETRVLVQRIIQARGAGPIPDVIEFDAITRIFDISNGVPEVVEHLVGECLVECPRSKISMAVVERIAARLRLASPVAASSPAKLEVINGGCLIVSVDGQVVGQRTIDRRKLKIGRDVSADLRLTGNAVSRLHALLEWTSDGVQLIDLGSTNGTFVDDVRVRNAQLAGDSRIRIGNFELRYVDSRYAFADGTPPDAALYR